jgi:hypothetical protein
MKAVKSYRKGGNVSLKMGEHKSREGGLTRKGIAKYNRETGSNLQPAVTESNPKGRRAARRKSFCARMSGVKGPLKKNGKPTRKLLALRKWRCRNYK